MKFLRSRLLNILIAFITILTVIAVIIGIRVSITMVKRHNQMLKKLPSEQNVVVQDVNKPASVGSLKDQTFYFNGESIDALAYLAGRDEIYFPYDAILHKLGMKFTSYSSDDIITSEINGKQLLMTLGKSAFKYGGQEMNLDSIPITSKNHILVPSELLVRFEGFKAIRDEMKDTAFLDYWPGFGKSIDKNIKVLAIEEKMPEMLDMAGYPMTDLSKILKTADKMLVSPDHTKFIAISSNAVYLWEKGDKTIRPIPASVTASWSADSEYLYWIDAMKKTSFVYDLESKKVEELGNYYYKAVSLDEEGLQKYTGKRLYVFVKGTDFRRIVLTNATYDNKYIFIERNGRTVVKGEFEYSPDKTRILYKNADHYYFLSNLDGTGQYCLGQYDVARWVDNDKIFVHEAEKSYIFSRSEKKKTEVHDDWYKVGQTDNGDVYFMHGDTLYCESDWVEKKIMMISGGCDYIAALSGKGPYIIASQKEDNILYLNNDDTIRYLGKFSSLVESSKDGEIFTDFKNNILVSPDKKIIAVFQKNQNYISLNVINSRGTSIRNICLDYSLSDSTDIYNITPLWISNDKLMLTSEKKVWVIGFNGSTKVYAWDSKEGKQIQGILQ